MFENDIDRINRLIIKSTIGNSDKISVKEILASEIPLVLRTLIRVDVEQKLHEELQNIHIHSRFDFSHPEVVSLQNQMNSFLVLNYYFEKDEYSELVNDSVHLMLNYLIRPQWTLKNFIFDKTNQVSSDEIFRALKHFGAFEYLKEIIKRILIERNIKLIDKEEFKKLIWKCDKEFIRRKDGHQLAQITKAIYDFVNYGKGNLQKTLPTKGLIKFFEDKGLTMVIERLSIELQRNVQEISYEDLSLILEDLRRNKGSFEPEYLLAKEIKQQSSSMEPLLTTTEQTSNETQYKKDSELEPLEKLISESDHRRFLKKIFKKDEDVYNQAIAELNKMTSWKQSSVYIDEIFILNEIDPYIPEAVRFTEVVYKRFFPSLQK